MTEFKCSATFKRAEQLKRWEESETNRHSSSPKGSSRIRFSVDCVFLAACAAGDKDEVLRLVHNGADVNTPSVDGLTALHQACIDAKLDMVEFLLKLGADVNQSDNEGWTPLHATASCGFLSIAHYLLSRGANLSAVNNEAELPMDIAEAGPMKQFLVNEMEKQNIDCDRARSEEERLLMEHSKKWFITKSSDAEQPDEKTGATPLHIAAAKGYIKVLHMLLGNCGVEVDPVDLDGWTPLHASAHWGQPEAATILIQYGADMDIKNCVGQTCLDVAVSSMVDHLEDLKNRHETIELSIYNKQKRRPPAPEDLPSKVQKVELQIENKNTIENNIGNKKTVEKKNALNNSHLPPLESKPGKVSTMPPAPLGPTETPPLEEEPSWRHSARQKNAISFGEKESPTTLQDNDIILRRTQSDTDKILNQQDKAKKEGTQLTTNASPARSSVENANEHNDIANKSVSTEAQTSKLFPGNIFKNFFKSFVPPVRDEESETQRKAHAKRVRETRRSTQGVTLDEIKSAEQLVKKKNSSLLNSKSESEISIKKDAPSANVDSESSQKDAVGAEEIWTGEKEDTNENAVEPVDTETTITIALPRSAVQKKDDEKDSENRVATQAAQNVIQRRRRPKRRSTGVVNVDLDEITPDQSANEGTESGSESTEQNESDKSPTSEENNEVDYKALWETSQKEVKQLKDNVLTLEQELADAKQQIEKYTNLIASVTEIEKREKRVRRATERKMSEMEEELKLQQSLQAENKKLKDENRALIRVISKLSK